VTSRRADLALFFNVLIWGITFVLIKAALRDISPLLFLSLRFAVASLALLLLFRPSRKVRDLRKTIAAGCLSGLFLYAGFLFQTLGLRLTSVPKCAFLTALSSVMVPLLARLVYKSRPKLLEVAGVLVATMGMYLMMFRNGATSMNGGDVLVLLCAAAFAAHIVTLGHFSEQMSFEVLSLSQVVTAAVLALSFFSGWETPYVRWRPAVVYAILMTGIFATAVAFTVQAWAQQYTTATRTALIYMLEPVVAWITSYLVAGEGLSRRAVVGAILILGGVFMVETKRWQSRPHPSN
jgi:drug/metabolite transporter (DMT)-like permease